MNRSDSSSTAIIVIALLIPLLALFAAYAGGYFLLADSKGLYSARWQYDMYEPVLKLQRKATGKPVWTGYVNSKGMRYALVLP